MKLLLILLILISQLVNCQIPKDKQYHFYAGATLGAWGTLIPEKREGLRPALIGITSATIAGIGKESYDVMTGGKFDVKDLGATMIGGIVSVGVIEVTKRIIRHKKLHKKYS